MCSPPAGPRVRPFEDFPLFRDQSVGDVLRWLRNPARGFSDRHTAGGDLGLAHYTAAGQNERQGGSHIFFRIRIGRNFWTREGMPAVEAVRIDARGHASTYEDADVTYRYPRLAERGLAALVGFDEPRHMHKELVPRQVLEQYLHGQVPGCDLYDDLGNFIDPYDAQGNRIRPGTPAFFRNLAAAHIWLVP